MTTPADIDAIRERADEYARLSEERRGMTILDDNYYEIDRAYHQALYSTAKDVPALLAHVDALAERVRTLEAALRPFAGLPERYAAYTTKKRAEGVNVRDILDFTEWLNIYGEDPIVLLRAYTQAADALAANADAGNGGA